MTTIQAPQGYAILELDAQLNEVEGGIYIPDIARRLPAFTGTVTSFYPTPSQRRKGLDVDLMGQRVLISTYASQRFTYDGRDLCKVRLSQCSAIVYGDAVPKVLEASAIKRCRTCKTPAGGNLFLDGNGVCPQCGSDAKGDKVPVHEVQLSDGTVHKSHVEVTTSEDENHALGGPYAEDTVPRGTITSHAGQKHRGSLDPKVKTMQDLKREGYVES